jgi:hypothetical protein
MEIPSESPQPAPGRSRERRRVVPILLLLFGTVGMGVWSSRAVPEDTLKAETKEQSAAKFAMEIAGAIASFYALYDTLPIAFSGADWVGSTTGKHDLVAVLTAAQRPEVMQSNPKKINYLDGFKQAKKDASGKTIHGMDAVTDPLKPAIYDPWGQPFIVILDTNFDSMIANPLKAGGALPIRGKKGIVYSTGPPNADGTRNTDESKFIISW